MAVGGGTNHAAAGSAAVERLGDDQNQLPVLQHALMRTWDYWYRHHQANEPIDISDYDAVGNHRTGLIPAR